MAEFPNKFTDSAASKAQIMSNSSGRYHNLQDQCEFLLQVFCFFELLPFSNSNSFLELQILAHTNTTTTTTKEA